MIHPAALFLWRKNRSVRFSVRILLIFSVAMGVAALVSLESFSRRIGNTVEKDTKNLLAADFQVQAWRPIPDPVREAARQASKGGEILLQTDFVSTAFFPPTSDPVTVQVRALEGNYPFYGSFRVEPAQSIESLAAKSPAGQARILVDASLKNRGVEVGTIFSLGDIKVEVTGFILEEPNTVASAFALGPRIILHQSQASRTGLLVSGARAFNMVLVKSREKSADFRSNFRRISPDPHWKIITPERANDQAALVIDRMRSFLSFVAVAALLLGGLGVFMIFRSQFLLRLPEYLSLRCMGISRRALFQYVGLESFSLGLSGFAVGALLGTSLEYFLAQWAGRFLKIELAPLSYVQPILLGLVVSIVTVFLAILVPLREVLRIPVAQGLRDSHSHSSKFTPSDIGFLSLGLLGLLLLVTRDLKLMAIFLVFYWLYILLLWLTGEFFRKLLLPVAQRSGFFIKHSLLFFVREKADAQLLWIALGSSTLILSSVLFLGRTLREQIDFSNKIGIPNLFMLNVAPDDRPGLEKIFGGISFVPTMQARLSSLKGEAIQENPEESVDQGQFYRVREYTVTRRLSLDDGEELTDGAEIFGAPQAGIIRASLEEKFAARIGLKVGDAFQIEIAGVSLAAQVRSLRKVNWFNLRPNFFLVFNADDIKEAPVNYVGLATVPRDAIPEYQKKVQAFQSQITPLNGESITGRIIKLLNQLAFAVTAVSAFTGGASFFVFIGILLSRRPKKIQEVALWRLLGLGRLRLQMLPLSEFFFVSFLGMSLTGLFSMLVVFALCKWALNIPFIWPDWSAALGLWAALSLFFGSFAYLLYRDLYQKSGTVLMRDA